MRPPKNPALLGAVGTLLLVLVVLVTLNADRLPGVGPDGALRIEFAEAGGLEAGDDVVVSGATVGRVESIELDRGHVQVEASLGGTDVRLGTATRARIVTVTLLGRAALELVPEGGGRLDEGAVIPMARTSSPYDVTSALSQLTTEVEGIDKKGLTRALDQVSATFARTPGDVGTALDGIDRLAGAVAENDDALRSLLSRASRVSGVLADRDRQISTLLTSGASLLEELDARQEVITSVLRNGQELAVQLRSVLDENDAAVGPALDQLDRLLLVLNRNRADLSRAITGLRNYATAFGEAISSGPWFDAYVQNLTAPGSLAPLLSGIIP